jgi:hypothetical protein
MAIDVFLIVFYKYDTVDLHKLEKKYLAIITTVVFIPAFSFLFIRTPEKGPMYGSVTVCVPLKIYPRSSTLGRSGARSLLIGCSSV